jgi:hypothetical protein
MLLFIFRYPLTITNFLDKITIIRKITISISLIFDIRLDKLDLSFSKLSFSF